ncbi:pH regulation protein F [Candidatus Bipolaricaulota bacterium]|nr:pH regulation protein F [Candidatus Bipolaricaulota bacterium]
MLAVEIAVAASLAAVLWRLFRGPTAWDRLLAYNAISNRGILLLVLVGITEDQAPLLDVALVYGMLSFLGVVIVSQFLERGVRRS